MSPFGFYRVRSGVACSRLDNQFLNIRIIYIYIYLFLEFIMKVEDKIKDYQITKGWTEKPTIHLHDKDDDPPERNNLLQGLFGSKSSCM